MDDLTPLRYCSRTHPLLGLRRRDGRARSDFLCGGDPLDVGGYHGKNRPRAGSEGFLRRASLRTSPAQTHFPPVNAAAHLSEPLRMYPTFSLCLTSLTDTCTVCSMSSDLSVCLFLVLFAHIRLAPDDSLWACTCCNFGYPLFYY